MSQLTGRKNQSGANDSGFHVFKFSLFQEEGFWIKVVKFGVLFEIMKDWFKTSRKVSDMELDDSFFPTAIAVN